MLNDLRRISPFITFYLFLFAAHFLSQFNFVASQLMIYDDTVYFADYFLGRPVEAPSNFLPYWLLSVTAATDSIVAVKAFSILTLATIGTALAYIFSLFTPYRVFSFTAAAMLSFFPVAADQGFFVTGSHPSLGVAFALVAFALFFSAIAKKGPLTPLLFCASLAAFASSISSPTTMLMAFTPVIWVIIAQFILKLRWSLGSVVAITAWPILFHFFRGVGKFHYAGQGGWTDMSLLNMVGNVGSFFLVVTAAFRSLELFVFKPLVLTVTAAAVVALVFLYRHFAARAPLASSQAGGVETRRLLLTAIACAFISGVALAAPTLVVTTYLPRYAVPAFFFGGVLAGAGVLYVLRSRRNEVYLLCAAAALIAQTGLFAGYSLRKDAFEDLTRGHKAVRQAVEAHADQWGENAQIVILLPRGVLSPSQGHNHWSAGYIQALTRRGDLIALIGDERRIDSAPFVAAGAVDPDTFWSTVDGVSRRVPMKGLDQVRPIYAYKLMGDSGVVEPQAMLFQQNDGGFSFVEAGGAFRPNERGDGKTCSKDHGVFFWPVQNHGLTSPALLSEAYANKRVFDGANAAPVSLSAPAGRYVRAAFRLTSAEPPQERQAYSDTYPPMPFLSPLLSVYQIQDSYHFTSPGRASVVAQATRGVVEFTVSGIEGCFYTLRVGDEPPAILGERSISADWSFGAGFKDRIWRGEIEWVVQTDDPE